MRLLRRRHLRRRRRKCRLLGLDDALRLLESLLAPRLFGSLDELLLVALAVIYLLCALLARAAGVVALAPRVIVVYAGARCLMRLRP